MFHSSWPFHSGNARSILDQTRGSFTSEKEPQPVDISRSLGPSLQVEREQWSLESDRSLLAEIESQVGRLSRRWSIR